MNKITKETQGLNNMPLVGQILKREDGSFWIATSFENNNRLVNLETGTTIPLSYLFGDSKKEFKVFHGAITLETQ